MKIGNVDIHGKAVLAPMAGVADSAFRIMAREGGASLVYSELISAEGLVRDNLKTWDLMSFTPQERPIGIQLFGSEPDSMAAAVHHIEALHPDLIDLNFGCPVRKVIKHGAGAALLRDLPRIREIVRFVVRAANCPVTTKIRIGWDHGSIIAVETARICEGEGASAVTVHARTRSMGYDGTADWDHIRQVKQAVQIPVLGNGDVVTPQDARRLLGETGCDGVMIGRGAMGRPWIFQHVQHYLQTNELLPEPSPAERIHACLRHLDLAIRQKGEERAVREMRKHFAWYIKGLRGAGRLRAELFQMTEGGAVRDRLQVFINEE
jgi:tRNA-dihydrouridine synthase B